MDIPSACFGFLVCMGRSHHLFGICSCCTLVVLLLMNSAGVLQVSEGLLRCAQVRTGPCTPNVGSTPLALLLCLRTQDYAHVVHTCKCQ